jgi:glucosylceramidase
LAGSSFHCYAGTPGAQSTVHDAHPDKEVYFTECTGHYESYRGQGPDDNFAGDLVWEFENLIIGATRNWASTVLLWNLALNDSHGPHLGGCTNCRGFVTVSGDDFRFHVEYYVIAQASKFVSPGAYRIGSTTNGSGRIEHVAFRNPDRTKVLIVLNPSTTPVAFDVNWNGQRISYRLPRQSVATFKW